MVYGGTQTHTLIGKSLLVQTPGLDADAEEGPVVDLVEYGFIPTRLSLIVTRTAGSTALIALDIQGSINGVTYTSLAAVTAKDTEAVDDTLTAYRYFKCVCTTVGTGNTLTADWILGEW
jgi:hypothetical protein